ncbi:(d)CMP kinase [Metabacillus sp. GX 13764]|uniref:(d)CMP kinase n=1 Tax=Metabacillus kandeliae TaxID=2900151 RepID=UPI001E3AC144|nr:(d)CMP kinase [Metabacillus kandeliae]MCD7033347.1 (d)CMP kinase [Metabacillus kandeliae]
MSRKLSIAIDGPAAAGKSTVAKIIAEDLSYVYIDTGAMYRSLTYKAIQDGVSLEDEQGLCLLLSEMTIKLVPGLRQSVYINEEDVTEKIRTAEVTNQVSIAAMHAGVRGEMVKRQREMAEGGGVVMDGRDIGTHVLPDADIKIFLLASVEERSKRRHQENISKGFPSDLEQLKREIARRDQLDSEREVSPLIKAADAIEINTTSLSIEDVAGKIKALVVEKLQKEKNDLKS